LTASLLLLTGVILLILALVVFLWPGTRTRTAITPRDILEQDNLSEEYSTELAEPPVCSNSLEPVPELPESYGVDKLVLMVRDPYWLYAYWEVTATKLDEAGSMCDRRMWNESSPVLRVYDITGIDFNGYNANSFFDCGLDINAVNWHINVSAANRTYCADLGRILPDGSFVPIMRSNIVSTPRDSLSDKLDEEWMWIEGIYTKHVTGISSPLIVEEINRRMGNVPLGISSPGFDSHENR